jgi:hypothetical protein
MICVDVLMSDWRKEQLIFALEKQRFAESWTHVLDDFGC